MIHSIPTPKFVIMSNEGKPTQQNLRKARNHGKEPADFRWGFVEEFLRSRELSDNTKKAYTRNLRAFLDWTDKSLLEITARDLNRYKEHLKTKPSRRGGTLSNATINQTLGSLQSWFTWLTKMDYIEKNPALKIEQLKIDPPKALEWSKEEITALFDALTERGYFLAMDPFWSLRLKPLILMGFIHEYLYT